MKLLAIEILRTWMDRACWVLQDWIFLLPKIQIMVLFWRGRELLYLFFMYALWKNRNLKSTSSWRNDLLVTNRIASVFRTSKFLKKSNFRISFYGGKEMARLGIMANFYARWSAWFRIVLPAQINQSRHATCYYVRSYIPKTAISVMLRKWQFENISST